MTLDDAVRAFEVDFDVVDEIGFPPDLPENRRRWALSPCGEPYVTVMHCGVKPEGARLGWFAANGERAIEGWLASARGYARLEMASWPKVLRLTLYWRQRPELTQGEGAAGHRRGDRWQVYSRLVVSPVSLEGCRAQAHASASPSQGDDEAYLEREYLRYLREQKRKPDTAWIGRIPARYQDRRAAAHL